MLKNPEYLLAVDAGIRTGLALFDEIGKLVWYRSHNMGSLSSLKKAVYPILKSIENLSFLVIEGGGPIVKVWLNAAIKLGIPTQQIDASVWRKDMLFQREYRNGAIAKESAIQRAQQVIDASEARSQNPPTHDAAEAILIGYWAWINKNRGSK
ncbi:MAG: hypothetical protein RBS07_00330 [Lentimicrobium sp.]|jgi:hypothetical protein|nr:hypothetical protein [Lentimicrobium sp.]